MILGVTGTPGTGKTFFAERLSKRLGYSLFNVEDFIISNGLYLGYDKERDSYILDIDRALDEFNDVLRDGVVYEGLSLAYLVSDRFDYVIVLRCNPYILEERLKMKGFPPIKVRENLQAEILDVIVSEVYSRVSRDKVIQVDNSGDIDEKIDKVLNILEGGGDGCDRVDWLDLISSRNDIKRFFG